MNCHTLLFQYDKSSGPFRSGPDSWDVLFNPIDMMIKLKNMFLADDHCRVVLIVG